MTNQMTLKIGGSALTLNQDYSSELPANGDGRLGVKPPQNKFTPPKTVTLQTAKGESPVELHKRLLRQAASLAGLDGTTAQQDFVNKYGDSAIYWTEKDPSPIDGKEIKSSEISGQKVQYTLGADELTALRDAQKAYTKAGGILRTGASHVKIADKPEVSQTANTNEVGKPDPFAPKTIKFSVILQNKTGGTLEDKALLSYVQDRYAYEKTGLWGDSIGNIANSARIAGAKVTNISLQVAGNGKFFKGELSIADAKKIDEIYKREVAEANRLKDSFRNAMDKTVAESFARGFFKGAWADLKGNANLLYDLGAAAADPLGTIKKVGEAVSKVPQFASQIIGAAGEAASAVSQMSSGDMEKFAAELAQNGYTGLANLKGYELAEKLGEITGMVAVEAALLLTGSAAASAAFKAFEGTTIGKTVIATAEKTGVAVKARAAAFVSDEAATAAKARILKIFPVGQPLAVLPGAPLSPQIIADFGSLVGNKLNNGAMKFSQVVKELSNEVGGAVKAHLDELAEAYTAQMKKLGLKVDPEDLRITIKEWKVERAKNINEIIEVPRKSQIMNNGSPERAQLRQKIEQADFSDRTKHLDAKSPENAKKLSATGAKEAQFLPGIKVKELYKEAIEQAMNNGLFVKKEGAWYFFHKFDKPIGYNLGKETSWIRVELSGAPNLDGLGGKNTIHGYPISLEKVREYFPQVKGGK